LSDPVKVGVIGCGTISSVYMENARKYEMYEVVACADMIFERAEARAKEFGIPKVYTVDKLLEDPEIEMVINLTIPAAHAGITMACLRAGKHVYSEKPLATTLNEGKKILELARQKELRVGCAPDTFLGGAQQTCRKLIEDGILGDIVGASAFMMASGPESWHPDPAFFYKEGAGPLFDMGPYYITALINLIGPVTRVTGSARITSQERIITSKARYGERISVETPTYVASVLDLEGGPIATMITTFDVWGSRLPNIEIYGTYGTLVVPDPNGFGGTPLLKLRNKPEWQEIPLAYPRTENERGIGVADMAHAIRSGRPHRATADMGYHVLEVMHSIYQASSKERHVHISSHPQRPSPLPVDLPANLLDD